MNGENRTDEIERRDQYQIPRRALSRRVELRAKTELKRTTKPLPRKTRLPQGSRLPSKNAKRAKKRRERNFGDKADWIRSLSCACNGWDDGFCDRVVAAHWRSRGAGGTSADLLPLCDRHHGEQHALGVKTFAAKYPKVDFPGVAKRLEALWQSISASGREAGKDSALRYAGEVRPAVRSRTTNPATPQEDTPHE